jgi:uncharacterized membrane protein YagU involved in acid resistance
MPLPDCPEYKEFSPKKYSALPQLDYCIDIKYNECRLFLGGIILDWSSLINIFLISIAIYMLYTVLNKYFLSKLNINKWIVLGLAVLFLFVGMAMPALTSNLLLQYVPTTIFVFFFLWFADLAGLGGKRPVDSKKQVIKPKAKPNRAKYADKEFFENTKKKKK